MIEVYHTSKLQVPHPEVKYSRNELDFGPGFYFTTIRQQAEDYARRYTRLGEEAWLNIYEFDETADARIKRFEHYDEEWLNFIMECRRGNVVGDYDLIVGGIANDKVFNTLTLFFQGFLNKDEALRRLVYEKVNVQYCIRNQDFLDSCLKFKESLKL